MWRPVVLLTVVVAVTVTANPVKRQVGVSDDILFTTIDNNQATKSGGDAAQGASQDSTAQGAETDVNTEQPSLHSVGDISTEPPVNGVEITVEESSSIDLSALIDAGTDTQTEVPGIRVEDPKTEQPTLLDAGTDTQTEPVPTDGTVNEGAVKAELVSPTEAPATEAAVRVEESALSEEPAVISADGETTADPPVNREEGGLTEAPALLSADGETVNEGAGGGEEVPTAAPSLLEAGTEAPGEGTGGEGGALRAEEVVYTEQPPLPEAGPETPTDSSGNAGGTRAEEDTSTQQPTLLEAGTDTQTEVPINEVGVRVEEAIATQQPNALEEGSDAPTEVAVRAEGGGSTDQSTLVEAGTEPPGEGAGNEAPENTSVLREKEGAQTESPNNSGTDAESQSGSSAQGVGAVVVSVNGEALTEFSNPNDSPIEDTKAGSSKGVDGEPEEYWLMMNPNEQSNKDESKTVDEKFEEVAEKYGLSSTKSDPPEEGHNVESDVKPQPRATPDTGSANQLPTLTDRVARFVGKLF